MKRAFFGVAALALLLTACGGTTSSTETSGAGATKPVASEGAMTEIAQETSGDAASAESTAGAEESEAENAASGDGNVALTPEEQKYVEVEREFRDITVAEMVQKMEDGETALIYAGRLNCPYCLKLMPTLGEIVGDRKLEVYSLDSQDNEEFEQFAQEHGIEYVPALLYIQEGALTNLPLESPYPRADVEKALDDVGL